MSRSDTRDRRLDDRADDESIATGRSLADFVMHHQRQGWRRGERPLVEAYVADEPDLQADPETLLDLIYHEVVLREAAGETPHLGEYLDRFPELAPQLRLQFELEEAIRPEPRLPDGEGVRAASRTAGRSGAADSDAVADYEILDEIGRGGMGIVYKARQARLNRVVALKMILAGSHAAPESAARFLAEAEAIARIQHPNIVRVYAFGDHEGRPYFVMEYVGSGTLADRLGGTPRPARAAAELIATLARAMMVVHRLGIIHRDLKPANILLDEDGTPKIADFGLAKDLHADSAQTGTRAILGSPSYMAPEQASGSPEEVGPETDVYALGAILYELLTGRPPFAGETPLATLEQVRDREPVPPSQLQRSVPRDLETICLSCLRKERSKRYPDTRELAEDLDRFLTGRPIRARPVGRIEQWWSWCRREPVLAGLLAGLFLALTLGFAGVGSQWYRAEALLKEAQHHRSLAESNLKEAQYHRSLAEVNYQSQLELNQALRQANDREASARRRAQERFDAALKALQAFETAAGDATLLREPQMEGLRKQLHQASLEFYRELQASLETDASRGSRARLAEAYSRVGKLSAGLGQFDDALAANTRALALLTRMATELPSDRMVKKALARSHVEIGIVLNKQGRPAEALMSFQQAWPLQAELVRDDPADPDAQEWMSWVLGNMGASHLWLGRADEAARFHEQVLEIREALLARDPGNTRYQSNRAWTVYELGLTREATGEFSESLALFDRATALQDEVVRGDPTQPENLRRIAWCLEAAGRLRLRLGQATEAAEPLERATAYRETLAQAHPARYREDLARSFIRIAMQRASARRHGDALDYIRRTESVLRQCPSVRPEMLYDLACAYSFCYGAAPRDREATRGGDGDLAVTKLRRATEAGYVDLEQIRRDPDLDPIRSHPGFRLLLLDLAVPADPFAP